MAQVVPLRTIRPAAFLLATSLWAASSFACAADACLSESANVGEIEVDDGTQLLQLRGQSRSQSAFGPIHHDPPSGGSHGAPIIDHEEVSGPVFAGAIDEWANVKEDAPAGLKFALTFFKAAPKVELHSHLDGALQPRTLCELAFANAGSQGTLLNTTYLAEGMPDGCRGGNRNGLRPLQPPLIPSDDLDACARLLQSFVTAKSTSTLAEFLEPFPCIGDYLALPGGIAEMAKTFVHQQALENIVYSEGNFAPQLLVPGCTPFATCNATSPAFRQDTIDVVKGVIDGIVDVQHQSGVVVNVILDCLRNLNISFCDEILSIVVEMKTSTDTGTTRVGETFRYSDYIVGVGLAGGEAGFPNSANPGGGLSYAELFAKYRPDFQRLGIGVAPHSGEPNFPESAADCKSAIGKMGSARIGHGYHCTVPVWKDIQARDLHIEVCPSSSKSTGAVAAAWGDHPIRAMMELGVSLSLNTDDRAVIGNTMTKEFGLAFFNLDFSIEDLVRATIEGSKHSFATARQKESTQREVRKWWMAQLHDQQSEIHRLASAAELLSLASYLWA